MSGRASIPRCFGVWVLVSSIVASLLFWLAHDLVRIGDLVGSGHLGQVPFDELLALLAASTVAACALWFWLVTTITALEAAGGATAGTSRLPAIGCPEGLRRLVFAACGLALASGLVTPAMAVEGKQSLPPPDTARLAGLPLPERASTHPSSAVGGIVAAPTTTLTVHVRAGDTLWNLAASSLAPGASATDIATTWRAIYAHNKSVIGDDPDLILPGTTLSIPDTQEESR
jgi:LysM repeat protein